MKVRVILKATCSCGVKGRWQGKCFFDAYRFAVAAGWRFDSLVRKAFCPKHPEKRDETVRKLKERKR